MVFRLFCKLSVKLAVIKKKKKKKGSKREVKMIVWVRICFYIVKKLSIGLSCLTVCGLFAAYKFNSRK